MTRESLSGRKLGNYDVGPLVGSGGMGESSATGQLAKMVIVLNWVEEMKARLPAP